MNRGRKSFTLLVVKDQLGVIILHSLNNLLKCQINNVVDPKVVTKLVANISFSCSNNYLETIQIAK
jgi:hypothetical protein